MKEYIIPILVLSPVVFGIFVLDDMLRTCTVETLNDKHSGVVENIGMTEFRTREPDRRYWVVQYFNENITDNQYGRINCGYRRGSLDLNTAFLRDHFKEYLYAVFNVNAMNTVDYTAILADSYGGSMPSFVLTEAEALLNGTIRV